MKGEISYLEFSETEEEFVLNPQTFPVTVVIAKSSATEHPKPDTLTIS